MNQQRYNDAEIQQEARRYGAQCAKDCKVGQRVTLHGIVQRVSYQPQGKALLYKVSLDDGTRLINLIFLGRRYIPGVDPGRHLSVNGLLQKHEDTLTIFNPRYDLKPL